jgi:putative membrane protein (TIGR04086 family)
LDGLRKNYIYVGKGVLRSCVITLFIAFIIALVQTFGNIGESVLSVSILVTTMISIIYGTIYATRKINSKGWIIGILVALLYMIMIYITSAVLGSRDSLAIKDLWRLLLALAAGALSGMLGINL